MLKSIDEAVKGIDGKAEINVRDFINLDKAAYISRRDKVELLSLTDNSAAGTNTAAFKAIAEEIKKTTNGKPALVGAIDAVHYNFVNGNFGYYMIEYMSANAKTWIVEIADGRNYGRPVQVDHSTNQEDTLGRVHVATPYKYKLNDNLFVPDGHIELIYSIVAPEGIEKIIDGRMRTVSVSANSTADEVTCSICGEPVRSMSCMHCRGMYYEVEDKNSKKGALKRELAYWKFKNRRYVEMSFVSTPADQHALNKKFTLFNIEGMETQAEDKKQNDANFSSRFSIFTGVQATDAIKIIVPSDFQNTIVSEDSVSEKQTCLSFEVQKPVVDPASRDSAQPAPTQVVVAADAGSGKIPTASVTTTDKKIPTFGLLAAMLKAGQIKLEDAYNVMYSFDLYVPLRERTNDKVYAILTSFLESNDSALAPSKIHRVQISDYAGPMKTIPVMDKEHVLAAIDLMDVYSGNDKPRVTAVLQRKLTAFSGSETPESKDNKYMKEDNVKFQADSEDELLKLAPVVKALDTLKSSHEQAIDQLNKLIATKEASFKTIAVDSIIEAAIKLKKPLVSDMLTASDEASKKEKRKAISDKLTTRSLDSLADTLADYNGELSLVSKDANQEKIEAAAAGAPAPAAPAAGASADAGKTAEQLAADKAAAEKAAADKVAADKAAKLKEELNNPGAGAGESTVLSGADILASFSKKLTI